MQTRKKRIALLVDGNLIKRSGGIGQFIMGMVRIAGQLDCFVDLILDKDTSLRKAREIVGDDVNIFACNKPLPQGKVFSFSEAFNQETVINYRHGLMEALQSATYDVVVCNRLEPLLTCIGMGLHRKMPVVFYTHDNEFVWGHGPDSFYDKSFVDIANVLMRTEGVLIGTQTFTTMNNLSAQELYAYHLPLPLGEEMTGKPVPTKDRNGVLFIGRWELRKNYQAYLDVIKSTGLPARIMTSSTSAAKFEKWFKENKIENYDIRVELSGREKWNFIQNSKLCFMPSMKETFCYGMLECLPFIPVVVLEYDWPETNFPKWPFHQVHTKDAVSEVMRIYHDTKDYDETLLLKEYETNFISQWKEFMKEFKPLRGNSKSSNFAKEFEEGYLHDFYETITKKRAVSVEDFNSVFNAIDNYVTMQTQKGTWISKTGNLPTQIPEKETLSLEDLF